MSRKHQEWIEETALRIRFHRRRHKLSQAGLARRAGVTASHVGHIEQARKMPSLGMVFRLAEALSVVPAQLLPGFEKDRTAIQVALDRLSNEFALKDDEFYPC